MEILGIDIGGTGIKGGIVDALSGQLLTERIKILTPSPATPESVSLVVRSIADQLGFAGPMGVGFPAIMRRGVAHSASNIDASWLGTDVEQVLQHYTGNRAYVANDADVAGLAEMAYGDLPSRQGVVLFLTIGTGIGSALFMDGKLVPNTELGHVYWTNGESAERYVSNKVRKLENLSWELFGKRMNRYLKHLEKLFSPDLFVVGGGISKNFPDFERQLEVRAPVVAATLLNSAGVIGAAMYARVRIEEQALVEAKGSD